MICPGRLILVRDYQVGENEMLDTKKCYGYGTPFLFHAPKDADESELPPADLPNLEPGKRYLIRYTNYRGETADRLIEPLQHRYWGRTEYHPEYQWLIKALDVQRGVDRTFALKDMVVLSAPDDAATPTTPTP